MGGEGRELGKRRAGHILAGKVVVADGAEEYGAVAEPIERLDGGIEQKGIGRIVVVDESPLRPCQRQFGLGDAGRGKAGERGSIHGRKPRVAALDETVVAVDD